MVRSRKYKVISLVVITLFGLIILTDFDISNRVVTFNGSAKNEISSQELKIPNVGINDSDIDTIRKTLECDENIKYGKFRIIQIRAGNSLEGYRKIRSCFIESDFIYSPSGLIISSHDVELGGDCGNISESSLEILNNCILESGNHPAYIYDFLSLPVTEWFIDLKSSAEEKDIFQSVKNTVDAILENNRKDGAVVMLYGNNPEVTELIDKNDIRAGVKGYPKNISEAYSMIDKADELGFEMVCFNIKYVNRQILEYARSKEVWVLAWETGEIPESDWPLLVEQGLGGIITNRTQLARNIIHPTLR